MANDKVALWGDSLKFGRSPASGELLVGNGSGFDLTASNVTWGNPIEFAVPIKVDGQVWSTTTGFKFPDNTVQTTAASSYAPPSVANNTIISNVSGGAAAAGANTLTQVLDATAGNARGSVIYRGASAWTALAPGTAGQVLTTGGTGADPSWGAGSAWTTIDKTTDQSITSSTTFVDDTQLQFSMAANSVYAIRCCYFINYLTGGLRLAFNGPSATRIRAVVFANTAATTAYDTTFFNVAGTGSVTAAVVAFNIGITVSSSPGTFALRIAQNVSDAGASIFEAGSWLEYQKVP
jgi:hypothetical protein